MDLKLTSRYVEELSDVIAVMRDNVRKAKYGDCSDLPSETLQLMVTRAQAAISRICPRSSYQYDAELISRFPFLNDRVRPLLGILEALLEDIQKGFLQGYAELIRRELFSDFVEMAEHLADNGYKDAAAVIAGSSLEVHLRQLCKKNGISLTYGDSNGRKRDKMGDRMNTDLGKDKVYSKSEQQQVTAWLAIRNNAAHGKYEEYGKEQVQNMILGIRDFMIRNSA